MTTKDNRIMTLKERYILFKDNNTNQQIADLLDLMEHIEENPSSQGIKALKGAKKSAQEQINDLSEEDKELIERLYNLVLFNAKKNEDKGFTKWDFFIETSERNDWKPVHKMIEYLKENDERFEELRFGEKEVSEKVLLVQQQKDKEDLEALENMLENEVLPWASENVSLYYQDMIERTLRTKLRIIQNRLKRNTDLAFSEWLRNTRKEKKMTLQEVADKSDTSVSYIQRLEKGKRKLPSLPIVQSIADALGAPRHEVLTIVSGESDDSKPTPIFDVVRQGNYLLKGQEVESEQRKLLEELLRAALNENEKSEMDNIIELPNIARRLVASLEKVEQEDMSANN